IRQALRDAGERYLVALPPDTRVSSPEDGAGPPAVRIGGAAARCLTVQNWARARPDGAWARPGGPGDGAAPGRLEVLAERLAVGRDERRPVPLEETLVVVRRGRDEGEASYDYFLTNAPPTTPPEEFAFAAGAPGRTDGSLRGAIERAG